MAKKKDFLVDFSFSKFENLSGGIEIPISNSLKTAKGTIPGNSTIDDGQQSQGENEQVQSHRARSKPKSKAKVEIPVLNYSNKGVRAMVNVVPTSVVPTPKRESIKDADIDVLELGSLTTKEEKVLYLAMRGWSLKVEQRRNGLYHYATKYIKRKKQRIYLGPI